MVQGLEISEYTYEDQCEWDNIMPIETWENTKVIHGNMVKTGAYIEEGFNKILEQIATVIGEVKVLKNSRLLISDGIDREGIENLVGEGFQKLTGEDESIVISRSAEHSKDILEESNVLPKQKFKDVSDDMTDGIKDLDMKLE